MRVGCYFPAYVPELGGGYTFETEMLAALGRKAGESKHEFVIFVPQTRQKSDPDRTSLVAGKLKVVYVKDSSRMEGAVYLFRKVMGKFFTPNSSVLPSTPLQRALQKEKIELIWFPTPVHVDVDIPYITTVWDIQHRLQPWFPEVSQNGRWQNREAYYATHLRRAAFVLTPNRAGQEELSFFYQIPKERFRLLPHPTPDVNNIPTQDEAARVLREYSIVNEYLFYPAQFWAHKNHVNILLALKILAEDYGLKLNLVFVGSDQGNQQHVRSMARELGVYDSVHFLGFLPREHVIALYTAAFALIYVSFFGPENLPPLEAFALGCPVIASNVNGAEEQLGDAVLLVDPCNPQQIAKSIVQLRENRELRLDLIEKGRLRASKYTNEDYIQDLLNVIDEFAPIRRNWGV